MPILSGLSLGGQVTAGGRQAHAANIVEHPQVVADRIVRFAKVIGRENVIAGTDCGPGGRIYPRMPGRNLWR